MQTIKRKCLITEHGNFNLNLNQILFTKVGPYSTMEFQNSTRESCSGPFTREHPVPVLLRENPVPVRLRENPVPVRLRENPVTVRLRENPVPVRLRENPVPVRFRDNHTVPVRLRENPVPVCLRENHPVLVRLRENHPVPVRSAFLTVQQSKYPGQPVCQIGGSVHYIGCTNLPSEYDNLTPI